MRKQKESQIFAISFFKISKQSVFNLLSNEVNQIMLVFVDYVIFSQKCSNFLLYMDENQKLQQLEICLLILMPIQKTVCRLIRFKSQNYLFKIFNNPLMKAQSGKMAAFKQQNPKAFSINQDESVFNNIVYPSNRTQCNLCKRDITKSSKILIAQQQDQRKHLCISCFTNSDEYPQQYHVINKQDSPLFEHLWSAYEELLLFQGLQKHGFGNWVDIADFIGNNKSPEEVEEHYQQVYIKTSSFLPNNPILIKRNQNGMLVEIENDNQPRRLSKGNSRSAQQTHQANRASQPAIKVPKINTNPAEIVGFMPRRGDFQIQYDNDAQLLLAEMEFNEDDTEEEKLMKFRLMDIYNHKLAERNKRKDFVISRKLLDIREQMRLDKTRTKDQKQIYNIMKVFARFNPPQQHDKIVQGLIKQKQIRQRIAEIKQLKAKGLKTLGQLEDQLDNKRKKDDKSKRRDTDALSLDKSKTRRVRKDPMVQKSQKRVLYINKDEQQLCKILNMTFKQYMMMKQTILRQSVRIGLISKNEISGLLQVKKQIFDTVYDFLVQQEGLLMKQNSVASQIQ